MHHEDVRRGGGDTTPRPEEERRTVEDAPVEESLHRGAGFMTRAAKGVGLDLVAPDGDAIAARQPAPRVRASHGHAGRDRLFLSRPGRRRPRRDRRGSRRRSPSCAARTSACRSRRTPTRPGAGGAGQRPAALGCDAEVDRTEPRNASAGGGAPTPHTVAPDLRTGLGAPAGRGRHARAAAVARPHHTVVSRPGGRRAGPVSRRGGRRVDSAPGRHPDPRSPVAVGGARGPPPGPHHGSPGRRAAPRESTWRCRSPCTTTLITRSAFDRDLVGPGLRDGPPRSPALSAQRAHHRRPGRDHPHHPRARGHRPHRRRELDRGPGLRAGVCADVYPVKVASPTAPAAPRTRPPNSSPISSTTRRRRPRAPTGRAGGAPRACRPRRPTPRASVPSASAGAVDALGSPITDIGVGGPGPAHTRTRARHRGTARASRDTRVVSALGPSPRRPARQTLSQSFVPVAAGALVDAGLGKSSTPSSNGGRGDRPPVARSMPPAGPGCRAVPSTRRPSTTWRRSYGHVVVPPGRRVGSHRAAHPHPALHLVLGS